MFAKHTLKYMRNIWLATNRVNCFRERSNGARWFNVGPKALRTLEATWFYSKQTTSAVTTRTHCSTIHTQNTHSRTYQEVFVALVTRLGLDTKGLGSTQSRNGDCEPLCAQHNFSDNEPHLPAAVTGTRWHGMLVPTRACPSR